MTRKVIQTTCQLCYLGCGIDATVENGKITEVTGSKSFPLNEGFICIKGRSMIEYQYDPDRIHHPMKKVDGKWQQITWDEALDLIKGKLLEIKQNYGPQAVAITIGMPVLLSGTSAVSMIRKFAHAFGSSSIFSVESICFRCQIISSILTLGSYYVPDPRNSKLIVVWGKNPENSAPPLTTWINKARKEGSQLVVVDPRATNIASRADLHIQPRPGTDCALMLGMMNVIINEKLYDEDFVNNWTVGFDKLVEHVQDYPPEKVAKITWVPEENIKQFAREFAKAESACILQGTNALDQTSTGLNSSRAIEILEAITGNLDKKGGFVKGPKLPTSPVTVKELERLPLGIDKYSPFHSVFVREFGEGQAMVLPDTILTGEPYPVKALIVSGSNPLMTWPDSNKVKEAFEKLDFLVVMGQVMSETAEIADLFLPAATFLERNELNDYYSTLWAIPHVMLRKKILQGGEAWSDLTFWLELAKKMGYEEEFPWQNEDEFIDYLLKPSGYDLKSLTEEYPGGVNVGEVKYESYKKKGFRTPSKKVEIYSEYLKNLGHDPVPTYKEPPESPESSPELAKEFPLILTTGARDKHFTHSQHRNLPTLRRKSPEPFAEIHVETVAQYGLKDGDLISVETKRGTIKLKAKVTERILPGIINIPHGWSEANVNSLTSLEVADPVLGYPALKALLCRVNKAG